MSAKPIRLFISYCKEVKARRLNIPSCLLVIYAIGVGLSIEISDNIIFGLLTNPEEPSCWAPFPEIRGLSYLVPTLQYIFLSFVYPFLGWLADTQIGRERAIKSSLWSCWLGTLLQVISYCIQYGTCGLSVNIAKYGISGVALLLLMFGAAGFYSNILAYGMDQLVNGSSAQFRAFIHWVVWGLFVGFLVNDYIAFVDKTVYNATLTQITGIETFAFITVIVCISIKFQKNFVYVGILKKNPYKMVCQVLKYAWQHNSPENRSAFTYWENKIPSRIDLGKQKYGGPFTEEEVEDTKTFWRIVAVLLSTFGIFIPYYTVIIGVILYINKLDGAVTTLNGYGSYVLWMSFGKTVVILVPTMELVVIPLLPKMEFFLLNPLKWIGVSFFAIFTSVSAMIVINIAGQYEGDPVNQTEYFNDHTTTNVSFLYYIIPLFFIGFINIICFISSFEFICSQAPANMNGMLIGVYWFIRALYISIGGVITTIFFKVPKVNEGSKLSTAFWSLFSQLIIITVGSVVYFITAYWYQRRQRGENYSTQTVVEEYYIRMLTTINREDELVKESLSVEYVIESGENIFNTK